MHLSLQDLIAIWGPSLTLTGFMWYHFNKSMSELKVDIKRVEEKLDAVKDRVSRIEGQLAPASFVTFKQPESKKSVRSAHSS